MKANKITNCLVCGKQLTKRQVYAGQQCCSVVCSARNTDKMARMRKTMLAKYGVDHFSKTDQFAEKIKSTWMSKTPMEVDVINKSVEKTNLKRYGARRPLQNPQCHNKMVQTNLFKHGCENVFQNDDVKKTAKATNLKRYGVENARQHKDIVEKAKKTCLDRYGVSVPIQSPEIKERMFKKILDQTFNDLVERVRDHVSPLFTREEYTGITRGQSYPWMCVKCGNRFEQHIHTTQIDGVVCHVPRCLICHPYLSGFSYLEKELVDFVKDVCDSDVVENDKTVLDGKELDIYLPDKKLAIEFNGLFWHSEEYGKGHEYHLNKTNECEKLGIQLIHVFEDEWVEKQEIVKSRIKSALGIYDKVIYARKCRIWELDSKSSNRFLEHNHLQGKGGGSIRYGLYFNGDLVSVMTFGRPRFNKNYDFELIRFCSKLDTQVIGGASRLLKCFQRNHTGSIVSYADRRYSVGKLYQSLGFKLLSTSTPNYRWTRGNISLSRYQCQKHKLKELLGDNFNPELTENENMMLNGYNKIYDCGNLIFALNRRKNNE